MIRKPYINPDSSCPDLGSSLFVLLLCLAASPGCGAHHSPDTNTPDQNFVTSMNHLLGTSFDQGVQLQPVWTTYRQKKKSLEDSISKDSDQFLDELAKLHQDTVALARPHLEAAQSARLEEIFAERRQMVTRTRESTTRVAERAKTEAPLTRPPAKDANKGGGVQMNNSGGGGTW